MDYSCNEPHQIHKNVTQTTEKVQITIVSSCGQQCTVIVVDPNNEPVRDALLDSAGGSATMDIEPGNRLHVMFGGQGSDNGCQVNLDFK
jgi:hypothetical protein